MLLDARELDIGAVIEADVCVVGAGAAGITLARSLRGSGLRVVLMESGGLDLDDETQALYEGTAEGVQDVGLTGCRARQFGGSTVWWAGWCRPLDEDIFEDRAWVPRSGWPLSRAQLLPYYQEAHRVCQIGALEYAPEALAQRLGAPLLPLGDKLASSVVYQYSPPTRFGEVYRQELSDGDDVDVFLYANLVNIELSPMGDQVSELSFKTLSGVDFKVSADRYVLALGGLETPRMLLASRGQRPEGIGNEHDWVGRCFMEHPHFYAGAFMLLQSAPDMGLYLQRQVVSTDDGREDSPRDARIIAALGLTAAQRREAQVMALGATLSAFDFEASQDVTGELPSGLLAELMKAGGAESGFGLYGLDMRCEQMPHPDSRVTLTDDADPLGIPRLKVDWLVQPEDLDSVGRTLRRIGAALGQAGLGRLYMPQDDQGLFSPRYYAGGCHHMGTARMSASPEDGVVDSDCKVHGLGNLYIASSAVFPTGGFANPTLTIVALALRLGEHLQGRA